MDVVVAEVALAAEAALIVVDVVDVSIPSLVEPLVELSWGELSPLPWTTMTTTGKP